MGNSREVVSNQGETIHARLEETVRKHLASQYRRFPRQHEGFLDALSTAGERPLVLDLGCGTGMSSQLLRTVHPESFIIGIDKSLARLSRGAVAQGERLALLRGDAVDILLILEELSRMVSKTYLLFPNPWPKAEHVKRRWHGHPIFPTLLAMSGEIELRTNWGIYAEEFARALEIAGWSYELSPYHPEQMLTLHEKKYFESGHILYQVAALRPKVDEAEALSYE